MDLAKWPCQEEVAIDPTYHLHKSRAFPLLLRPPPPTSPLTPRINTLCLFCSLHFIAGACPRDLFLARCLSYFLSSLPKAAGAVLVSPPPQRRPRTPRPHPRRVMTLGVHQQGGSHGAFQPRAHGAQLWDGWAEQHHLRSQSVPILPFHPAPSRATILSHR